MKEFIKVFLLLAAYVLCPPKTYLFEVVSHSRRIVCANTELAPRAELGNIYSLARDDSKINTLQILSNYKS